MDPTTALHDAARAVEEIEHELKCQLERKMSQAADKALLLLQAVAVALRKAGDETPHPYCAAERLA